MPLQLYNTLTKQREKFIPLKKNTVGLYTCGPTVYNYAHIGNLRSYIFEDLLKRTLLFNKFTVKHVMNITDVGHLTSDSDLGEDKMLLAALREKKSVHTIADFYTKAFKADLKKLHILSPTIWCKATDHIKEQIAMIKLLEKKGYTYVNGGNVYFDISNIKDYGKLAQLNFDADTQARVEKDANKKNQHDFVLWFTKSKFQEQEMKWNSPWGKGYPGWHIECSAMATKYLGKQFDIHCGGIDHIPVHHTNELAQSEAANGKKPWVKYWLHNEFLVLSGGEKMAKSGGNFFTLSALEQRGYDPLDFRYFCLGTHYRKQLMFSDEALDGAKSARKRLNEHLLRMKENPVIRKPDKREKITLNAHRTEFIGAINDDLNTPKTLAALWNLVLNAVPSSKQKLKLIKEFDKVLGLNLNKVNKEKVQIPKEVKALAEQRLQARQHKDWKKADQLREKIKDLGYIIGDTKEGYEITKI